jgi:hypothetical protein
MQSEIGADDRVTTDIRNQSALGFEYYKNELLFRGSAPNADAKKEKTSMANGETRCPKCRSVIQEGAVKCLHCQSDLRTKGFWQKVQDSRDYIALPAAVLALVVTLFEPIPRIYRSVTGKDGANLAIFNPAVDLVSVENSNGKIERHVSVLRAFAANTGYATTAIDGAFFCLSKKEDTRYVLDTYNTQALAPAATSLDEGKAEVIVGKPRAILPINEDPGVPVEAFDCEMKAPMKIAAATCAIKYTDKYGCHVAQFPTPDGLEQLTAVEVRVVTQSRKGPDGGITALCNPTEYWSPRSKEDAVNDIDSGNVAYTINVPGREGVDIRVADDATGKRLITNSTAPAGADATHDLSALPGC